MYARRAFRWSVVARFTWVHLLIYTVYGIAVTAIATWLRGRDVDISLPSSPISIIGVAVAFYVGFKNNQSYDRYWEARKVWGGSQRQPLVRQCGADVRVTGSRW